MHEILDGGAPVGERVVVVDGLGRIAAASTAHFLAAQGHRVFITAHQYTIGAQIDSTTRPILELKLRELNVTMLPGTDVVGYAGRTITLRDCFTGRKHELRDMDALVYDMGGRANDTLYDALVQRDLNVTRIGDCVTRAVWRRHGTRGLSRI